MIEDLAKMIQDEGIATQLTDLFIGELPLDESDCIALMYAISPEPHKTFDVYEQTIDIWSRYKSSHDAYDRLKQVLDLFHKKHHYNTTSYHIFFSNALGMIEDMDRDAQRRKLYKLSIRFIYRPL